MIRRKLCCAALIALLAFAGCSRASESYDSLSALSEALSDAGVRCDQIKPGPQAKLVGDSGSCAEAEITLYIFESAQALKDWTRVGARLAPTVVGPNWAVTGESNTVEMVAKTLNAELIRAQDL